MKSVASNDNSNLIIIIVDLILNSLYIYKIEEFIYNASKKEYNQQLEETKQLK